MKNINKLGVALLLCTGLMGLCSAPVAALSGSDYTVSASSYPITEALTISTNIAGNIAVEQMFISASSTATAQTVSIYSNCGSTTTATLVYRAYIAAGETSNPSILLNLPLYNTPLYLTNACFRKSDAASSVQFNVHYR